MQMNHMIRSQQVKLVQICSGTTDITSTVGKLPICLIMLQYCESHFFFHYSQAVYNFVCECRSRVTMDAKCVTVAMAMDKGFVRRKVLILCFFS